MSAQLRYAGCTSPIEMKLLELLSRAKEPLHPKQCASRLGYTVEMVRTALGGLCAAGKLKRRKSWDVKRPFEYMLASQPWPNELHEPPAHVPRKPERVLRTKRPMQLTCAPCGHGFQLDKTDYTYRMKISNTGKVYCSISCGNVAAHKRRRAEREASRPLVIADDCWPKEQEVRAP